MTTNYYKKHKEKLGKEVCEENQILSEEEKDKRQIRPETDIKIFLKKKKKKGLSIIVNVIRIFLKNKSKSKLSI